MIKKLMDKFGYISKNDCFNMKHIDGKGYLELNNPYSTLFMAKNLL